MKMSRKSLILNLVTLAAMIVVVFAAMFNAMATDRVYDTLAFSFGAGAMSYIFVRGFVVAWNGQ